MAIQFHPMRPAVPMKPALPERPHAAAPARSEARLAPSSAKSALAKTAASFRAIFSPAVRAGSVPRAAEPSTASATPAPAAATPQPAPASTPAAATAPTPVAAPAANPNAVFTAEEVFGANPWLANPTGSGPNGITFGYNPLYFATPTTAAEVAKMVGGTVVQDNEFTKDTPGTPFAQQQPNQMVQLPSGGLINPGLIASLYTHGLPQYQIDQAVANEVASANASAMAIQT